MNRRRALAAILIAIPTMWITPAVQADVAPPPVLLRIQGQNASVTGAPDRAEFVLTNTSREAIEVYLYRIIVLDGSTRVPLPIESVEVDGRASRSTVTVPANGRIRVTAHFAMPESLAGRARYSIDLSIRQSGYGIAESQPATISRRTPRG